MAETDNSHNLRNRLLGRIHENDIHELCHVIQCCEDHSLLEQLYTLLFDSEKRVADNAAWLFTHLRCQPIKLVIPQMRRTDARSHEYIQRNKTPVTADAACSPAIM